MIVNRLAQGLRRQDWFTAILEIVILVIGIYIGLQVDDWVSERQDRKAEKTYLEQLVRDVAELQQQVIDQSVFEIDKVHRAARVIELLSTEDPAQHAAELGPLLTTLSSRRTISLSSATYEQMVSSGHLQLIRNVDLRDRVVRHFAQMKRDEAIISKNNQDLVDDIYGPFLLQIGISPRFDFMGPEAVINRGTQILSEQLGTDYRIPPDEVLQRPPGAESWNAIRRQVIFRMRIAAVGQAKCEDIQGYLMVVAEELAKELEGR